MENQESLLEEFDDTSTDPRKWKHFLIYAIICFALIFLSNVIGQNASPGDIVMKGLNIFAVVKIPLLLILLIRTYKAKLVLTFWEKFFFLVGLIVMLLLSTILVNWINPFGRSISLKDMREGIIWASTVYGVTLIFCLPIVGFLKSKTLTKPSRSRGK